MGSTAETISIRYTRPPDRLTLFEQKLLERRPDCVVTFLERAPLTERRVVDGVPIVEPSSSIVWFTFPGRWHDIGRFYLSDGRFTGIYANVLTPVRFLEQRTWETTDLFLDVWIDAAGRVSLLDVDELSNAQSAGWLDQVTADRAREEAAELVRLAERRAWPPAIVWEWTLERVTANG